MQRRIGVGQGGCPLHDPLFQHRVGLVEGRLSMEGVAQYLTFGYVLSPATMIEGVQALQPGHHLILDRGRLMVRRYWDLPTGSDRPASPSHTLTVALGPSRNASWREPRCSRKRCTPALFIGWRP